MSKGLELTSARWQLLGAVQDRPRTVAQIARRFESTRQGLLWVVSSLARDGLVEFIENPDHKRAKLVRLTEKGARAYAEVLRRQVVWTNGFSGRFDLSAIESAIAVVERLGDEAMARMA